MKDWFKRFTYFDDPNKLMPWKDKSPEPQGEEPEDRPEIPIKPGWYFVMYFIMGVGFDTLFPTYAFPENVRFTLGVGLVIAGAVLNSTSLVCYRDTRTNHETNKPAHALITEGPYRFSRNPIYLGYMCLFLGLGIFLNNLWIFVLGAPLLATVQVAIIAREEDYLAEKFGEEYGVYCQSVRRWL